MKKIIINNIIIISLILLLFIVIAVIYVADYTNRERENYSAVTFARINSIEDEAINRINTGKEEVNALTYQSFVDISNVPQNYDAIAFLSNETANDKIDILFKDGTSTQYTLFGGVYENFTSKEFDIMFFDRLFKEFNGNDSYLCYFKEVEGGTLALFNLSQKLFNSDYIFDFENIMLITSDGIIISDYTGTKRGKTLKSQNFSNDILENVSGTMHFDMLNSKKLLTFTNLDIEESSFKIAGYVSSQAEESFIQTGVTRLVVLIISVFIISCLSAGLFVYVYIKHINAIILYRQKKHLYVLKVTKTGEVLKSNEAYKEQFDVKRVFDNIFDTGVPSVKLLNDGLPIIVSLSDKLGHEKHIIFFNLKTFKGYKLIGQEATPIINLYIDNLSELRHNEKLRMYNKKQFDHDFEQLQEVLRTDDGLFVLIELRNINQYKSMFGDDFYKEIIVKYADIFKESLSKYGTIYFMGSESFIYLISSAYKSQLFKNSIGKLFTNFNMPIQLGKGLIKIYCVAGVVDLKGDIKTKEFDHIKSLAEFSLEKAYEVNDYYNIYDTAKDNFYLSYDRKKEIVKEIIENDDIEVNYQPQYSVIKEKIVGFEALTRIKGKHEKDLKVHEFIDIAERSGNMIALGDLVFNKTFEYAKEIEKYNVSISLNVSPVQLLQSGFVSNFLEKFKNYNLKKGSISLEITETFLMTSFKEMVAKLDVLKENGINIHLDDFGIAYSSMLYLKKLPISTIKIDREFVADITTNKYSRVICGKILEIAQSLDLSSVVEGVETEQQLICLKELGCKIIQGFYISGALPANQATAMLESYKGRI